MLAVNVSPAGDWPQWRGELRDGVAAEETIRDNWSKQSPELLWMVEGMGEGYASVAIADGVLYTTGNDTESQFAVAVDASNGERIWATPLTDKPPKHSYPGSRCTPTVDGDRVFVTTSDGSIASLSRADGQVIWQKSFALEWQGRLMSGWGFSESPLVDEGAVLCTPGGSEALIVKLDKLTGEEIWRLDHGDGFSVVPRPIYSPKTGLIYLSTGFGKPVLLAVRPDGKGDITGSDKIAWSEAKRIPARPSPILVGDELYVIADGGIASCLDATTGTLHWTERVDGNYSASPLFADGHLYFASQEGVVTVLKPGKTFEIVAQNQLEGTIMASPIAFDGSLVIRTGTAIYRFVK